MELLDPINFNNNLISKLKSGEKFFVTRPGGTENQVLLYAKENILTFPTVEDLYRLAKLHAGLESNGNFEQLHIFSDLYLNALKNSTHFGVWYPNNTKELQAFSYKLYDELGSKFFTNLESLMPWPAYFSGQEAYTLGLADKKVLVAHPFCRSIIDNYKNRASIKIISEILPAFNIETIMPPVTNAETKTDKLFSEHLETFKLKLKNIENSFDILIIGAGAYGAIVGDYAYTELNKSVLHLGGATQLLFGISGKRWTEHHFYKKIYENIIDPSWTKPYDDERPEGFNKIESGCYW